MNVSNNGKSGRQDAFCMPLQLIFKSAVGQFLIVSIELRVFPHLQLQTDTHVYYNMVRGQPSQLLD